MSDKQGRSSLYEKQDKIASESFGKLADKLQDDLNRGIRNLGESPLFSNSWYDATSVLSRLAHVSDVEMKMGEQKDGATLWETEESALRLFVEEAKTNMMLRELQQFKGEQEKQNFFKVEDITEEQKEMCINYEKGLGQILYNAWLHSEVLCSTDINGLIDHISCTLKRGLAHPTQLLDEPMNKGDLHLRQEIIVITYLHCFTRSIDSIGEDRFAPLIRTKEIFADSVKILADYHESIPKALLLRCLKALSDIVETEDYMTYKIQYFIDADTFEYFFNLQSNCLENFMYDMEYRKDVRPLYSAIDWGRRQFNKK